MLEELRQGFIVRTQEGWYNIIAQDKSTLEWFYDEQSITHLEDAVGMMKRQKMIILHSPTIENWMREDVLEDEVDKPNPDSPTLNDIILHGEDLPEEAETGECLLNAQDCFLFHGLDEEDDYSRYYQSIRTGRSPI